MKKLILCFLLCLFHTTYCKVIEDQANTEILTPAFSERETVKLILDNGLQAYVMSDPNTDQSAAAMTVKVGSWEDPKDSLGMAHFLEHMLFLGTKKYPDESEYSGFIQKNKGQTNAFTTNDQTSFMFSVNNNAFQGAIDRFAQFFREPLFNPSGVEREMHAIDQEFAKLLENDVMREYYVRKDLSNKEHPHHQFHIGNLKSLSNVTREELMHWYEKHYDAGKMRLIVVSALPIEELQETVEKLFSDVPHSNEMTTITEETASSPEYNGKLIVIEPVKDERKLSIVWELPKEFASNRDEQPESLVAFVLGHEGENSLLSQLKEEHLADSLSSGGFRTGEHHLEYIIEIGLTDKGVKEFEQVIERTFQAINMLKEKGIPRELFDEVQTMGKINYQYQDKDDVFTTMYRHARWIADEDLSTYPEQTLIVQKYDPDVIHNFIYALTPSTAQYYLLAKEKDTGVKAKKQEPWMGAYYSIHDFDPNTLESWAHVEPHENIDLPQLNPFIPRELKIMNRLNRNGIEIPHPSLIVKQQNSRVYFAPDTQYGMPKMNVIVEIKTPKIIESDAKSVVYGDLYVKALKEDLNTFSYPAQLAGLSFEIERTDNGIKITIKGYSEKASVLLEEILESIKDLEVTQQQFKLYKDSLLREYMNFNKEGPIQQASDVLKKVIYEYYSTHQQKAAAIRKLSYKSFKDFQNTVFDEYFVEGIIYGNFTEEQAKKLGNILTTTLNGKPYKVELQEEQEIIVLPQEKGPFFYSNKISALGNGVILTIQDPEFSFKRRAAQEIFMQGIKEPFFSELRTKQQTGYMIFSYDDEKEKVLLNYFAVQSNTHDGRDLLARFELFLEQYLQELVRDGINQEHFEGLKQAVLTSEKQPPKNIDEMGQLLFLLATKYHADFDWKAKRIEGIEQLKYDAFLDYVKSVYGKRNKRRLGVILQGTIPPDVVNYTQVRTIGALKKMSEYTSIDQPKM